MHIYIGDYVYTILLHHTYVIRLALLFVILWLIKFIYIFYPWKMSLGKLFRY